MIEKARDWQLFCIFLRNTIRTIRVINDSHCGGMHRGKLMRLDLNIILCVTRAPHHLIIPCSILLIISGVGLS